MHRTCTATSEASEAKIALARSSYAITGGLGGLGLRAATLLASCGSSQMVLTSRSGNVAHDGQRLAAQMHALASNVRLNVLASNVADRDEVASASAVHYSFSGFLQPFCPLIFFRL